MKPTKVFTRIIPNATQAAGKVLANAFEKENVGYNCKVVAFDNVLGKVITTSSENNRVVIDDITDYPLARSQEKLIKTYEIEYGSTSAIEYFSGAIDVCSYLVNKMFEDEDKMCIIKIIDNKTHEASKIVIPSVFADSKYITNVPAVVVGNPTNGESIITDELGTTLSLADGMVI